jgi:hypothetical protein
MVVPQLIEDAMYVCKVVSIPYLWVDFYCIDQSDPIRKTAEINSMGYIYRYSVVTLIAGTSSFSNAQGSS